MEKCFQNSFCQAEFHQSIRYYHEQILKHLCKLLFVQYSLYWFLGYSFPLPTSKWHELKVRGSVLTQNELTAWAFKLTLIIKQIPVSVVLYQLIKVPFLCWVLLPFSISSRRQVHFPLFRYSLMYSFCPSELNNRTGQHPWLGGDSKLGLRILHILLPLFYGLNLIYFVDFADYHINMLAPWQAWSDDKAYMFSTVNGFKTWDQRVTLVRICPVYA